MENKIPRRAAGAASAAAAVTRTIYKGANNKAEIQGIAFRLVLLSALTISLVMIGAIVAWAVVEGGSRVNIGLFTNNPSSFRPETAGYRPAILGTVQLILGVIAIIVPLGISAATFLELFADRTKWYNRIIELNIQNLAGVPSIVFGILVLPTVILASREAIRAVPSSLLDGALALGATRWQSVWKMVLPSAAPGMLTGVILAVARAIGEAAPLLLVGAATFVTFDPDFWNDSYSALPVMIYNYAGRPQEEFHTLAAAGILVMLVVLFFINSIAVWLRARYERTW
jgi:phosphate transport system permease protein